MGKVMELDRADYFSFNVRDCNSGSVVSKNGTTTSFDNTSHRSKNASAKKKHTPLDLLQVSKLNTPAESSGAGGKAKFASSIMT